MKPKQINIDGVLYDLTPVQQDSVNHTSAVNTRYEPARTPLFTTTDGKPVYEGEDFWLLFTAGEIGEPHATRARIGLLPFQVYQKTFSTSEAAEQWIADNKPLYSLNDLLAALPDEASKEGIAAILRAKKSSL